MPDQPDPAHQDAPPEKGEEERDWPAWAKGYLEAVRKNPSLSRAAEIAGISRTTALRLTHRDEAFALAVRDAREFALDQLEEMIYYRAVGGVPVQKRVTKTGADGKVETTVTEEFHISDTLAMFFLKRWRPEYREAFRVEQSGPDGGPIRVEVDRRPTRERMRELLEIARDLEDPGE